MLKLTNETTATLERRIQALAGKDAARVRVRELAATVGLLDEATNTARVELLGALRRARRRGASLGELGKDAGLSRARVGQLTAGAYFDGEGES